MSKSKLDPNISPREKILLLERYISISHNIADNWLVVRWHGERSHAEMIAGAEAMLQLVKEIACNKIINDSTDSMNAWPPDLIVWVADEFVPRLEAAGVHYFAWIYDDQNRTKVSADAILKREKSDIMVMVFDNFPTAETWLRSMH